MDKINVFTGYGYDTEGPFILIDESNRDNFSRTKVSVLDKTITLKKVENDRYCVGRFDLDTFHSSPCPHQSKLENTKNNTCFSCFNYNAFNPSFYNVPINTISEKQQRYNLSPHDVYLAYFSDTVQKVGIAHNKRTRTRLLEQGAKVASIILHCPDAYEARRVEVMVSKSLGLKETVNSSVKKSFLSQPYDESKAIETLSSLIKEIRDTTEIEVESFQLVTDLTDQFWSTTVPLKYVEIAMDITELNPFALSGKIVGMVGDILIFENNKNYFSASLKKIMSYQVSLLEKEVPLQLPNYQIKLF